MTDKPEAWIVDTGHTGWTNLDKALIFERLFLHYLEKLKAGDADSMSPHMASVYAYNLANYYHEHIREQKTQALADDIVRDTLRYSGYLGGVRA